MITQTEGRSENAHMENFLKIFINFRKQEFVTDNVYLIFQYYTIW